MPSNATLEHKKVLSEAAFDVIRGVRDIPLLIQRLTELWEYDGVVGVDTETTGLDPHRDRIRLIQIATSDRALIVDLEGFRVGDGRRVSWDEVGLLELKHLLEGPRIKALQNAAFDLNFLRREGIALGGRIFDTMVASKIINNGTGHKNNLGLLVERVLGVELPKELQKADWGGHITPEMFEYAARDAICLPRLVRPLRDALVGNKVADHRTLWDVFVVEMQALRPIAGMQWHGFGFDAEGAEELRKQLTTESEALQASFLMHLDDSIRARHPDAPEVWLPREIDGSFNTRSKDQGSVRLGTKVYAGFNPRSTKQMTARFEQAGIVLRPNDKGELSLDQNLLAFIRKDYALVDEYLTWKESVTKVSDIEKLLKSIGPDGRIHANYRQMGAESGRLSCAEPNLQQVNRGENFRSKFVADPGNLLVVADFSQIELRVAAELSGEERMIEAYRAGRDLHTETASLIAKVPFDKVTKTQRQSAKIANFGLLYGAGPATLRKQAVTQYGLDMDLKEAKEIVDGFRQAYPQLYAWQMREGNMTTKAVYTALGRRRFLLGFNDKYTTRLNTPVQGTAGDIAKLAIVELDKRLQEAPSGEARLIAMVHDEIVMEVQQEKAERWAQILKACMEAAGSAVCQHVPIVAEVSTGTSWADAK